MPKLICITGLDGAGKSTLVERLSTQFSSVAVSNIWDIMDGSIETVPFKSKADIDTYLCELTADSRLLFLAHALQFSIDKALQSEKEIILLNGYYYKYFATEMALGANVGLVEHLIKSFPTPDLVIKLELDVESSLKRKERLSKYECGAQPTSNSNFLNFQALVSEKWESFNQLNWKFISSAQSKQDVFDQAINTIKKQLV